MSEQPYDDLRREVTQELAASIKGVEIVFETPLLNQEQLARLRAELNESIDRASKRLEAITRDFESAPRPASSIAGRN
jgi:hypothetical protein